MQSFADWSKTIMEEKKDICNGWKELSKEESDKMRILFCRGRVYSKIWRGGVILGTIIMVFIVIKGILEKGSIDIIEMMVYMPIYIVAIVAAIYETQCEQKRKSNLWISREGILWMIEKKYYIRYSIKTYFVRTSNNEEISFDKNFVHGKVQEGDEVVLVRPIGSKEINMCLKEEYDNYIKENV